MESRTVDIGGLLYSNNHHGPNRQQSRSPGHLWLSALHTLSLNFHSNIFLLFESHNCTTRQLLLLFSHFAVDKNKSVASDWKAVESGRVPRQSEFWAHAIHCSTALFSILDRAIKQGELWFRSLYLRMWRSRRRRWEIHKAKQDVGSDLLTLVITEATAVTVPI